MGHKATLPLLLLLLLTRQASSQASSNHPQKAGEDKDPIAIVELGATTSWNFSGGAATFAPNLAAEVTPIENWLEIEAGVSPFYTHKSTEWTLNLPFTGRDHITKGRVHAGRRSRMGPCRQTEWESDQLDLWRWQEIPQQPLAVRYKHWVLHGFSNQLTTTVLLEATSSRWYERWPSSEISQNMEHKPTVT